MTDTETIPTPPAADPPASEATTPAPTDPWTIWFSRLIQVAGLVIILGQAFFYDTDRKWLLGVALAMLLGGTGLRLVVQWALNKAGAT